MAIARNPVGRLYRLLDAGRQVPNASLRVLDVWGKVLLAEDDDAGKLHRLVRLNRLWVQSMSLLRNQEDLDRELYLRGLDDMRVAFTLEHSFNTWGNVKKYLSSDPMLRLQFCSDFMAKKPSLDPEVEESELQEILSLIEEASSEVREREIDAELRLVLTGMLSDMRNAVQDYYILGRQGMAEGVQNAIGAVVIQRSAWQANGSAIPAKLRQALLALCGKLSIDVLKLGEKFGSLLE